MSQPPDASAPADDADATESVTVVDAPERHRFEIAVDGATAGFTEYVDATGSGEATGERTFPHTVVEEAFGGRGLATLLIRTALDATRVADLAVIPQCSAVARFIAKHPEYVDLVPQSRRAEFGL
jgi:uncharacterized protein